MPSQLVNKFPSVKAAIALAGAALVERGVPSRQVRQVIGPFVSNKYLHVARHLTAEQREDVESCYATLSDIANNGRVEAEIKRFIKQKGALRVHSVLKGVFQQPIAAE